MANYIETKQARTEAAKLTIADLEAMPVKSGLRPLIAAIGIVGKLPQDGKEVTISSAKKETLVKVIYEALEAERIAQSVVEDLTPEQIAEVHETEVYGNDVSMTDLGTIAKSYFDRIKDYVDNTLWNHGTWKATDGSLLAIALDFVRDLETRKSVKTGDYVTSQTVMAYKSRVKQLISEMMENVFNEPHKDKYHEIFDTVFGYVFEVDGTKKYRSGLVDKALARHAGIKATVDKFHLSERKTDPSKVRIGRLLERARILLSELQPTDKAHQNELWADVSVALMIVTGRRLSEVMATARFELIEGRPGWLMFSGQLKTKGREGGRDSYPIPVLTHPQDVIKALDWLGNNGKRTDDNQVAHKRYSKPLSAKSKDWDLFIDYDYRQEGKKLTCHLCRQIYAQLIKFHPYYKGTTHHNISDALGHGETDNATADRYDADLIVLDGDIWG